MSNARDMIRKEVKLRNLINAEQLAMRQLQEEVSLKVEMNRQVILGLIREAGLEIGMSYNIVDAGANSMFGILTPGLIEPERDAVVIKIEDD